MSENQPQERDLLSEINFDFVMRLIKDQLEAKWVELRLDAQQGNVVLVEYQKELRNLILELPKNIKINLSMGHALSRFNEMFDMKEVSDQNIIGFDVAKFGAFCGVIALLKTQK